MGKVRNAILAVVLLASGVYFVLYLLGWEWYRAFMAGVIFLAAEVALMGVHLGTVIRTNGRPAPEPGVGLEHAARARVPARSVHGERVVADVLRQTPPDRYDTFRWLRKSQGQFSVFIPLLLGAGVLMSGVAWVMERVAAVAYGDRIDDKVIQIAAPLIPTDDLLDTPTRAALLTSPGRWDDWQSTAYPGHRGPGDVTR